MEFEGVELIKDLPVGDSRIFHNVGISQTNVDDVYSNQVTVYVDCGRDLVGTTKFKKTDPPEEIELWVAHILLDHKTKCPITERMVLEIPKEIFDKFKTHIEKNGASMGQAIVGLIEYELQSHGIVLE